MFILSYICGFLKTLQIYNIMKKRLALLITSDVLGVIESAAEHPVLGSIMSEYHICGKYLILPKNGIKSKTLALLVKNGDVIELEV